MYKENNSTVTSEVAKAIAVKQAKIEALKKANPKGVWELSANGKTAYIRTPTRTEISYASSFLPHDRLGYADAILVNCWLEGDEELKTEDKYFLAITTQIDTVIEVEEVAIKKL